MNFMASGTIKSSPANPAHELRMYNLFLLGYLTESISGTYLEAASVCFSRHYDSLVDLMTSKIAIDWRFREPTRVPRR